MVIVATNPVLITIKTGRFWIGTYLPTYLLRTYSPRRWSDAATEDIFESGTLISSSLLFITILYGFVRSIYGKYCACSHQLEACLDGSDDGISREDCMVISSAGGLAKFVLLTGSLFLGFDSMTLVDPQ